MGRRLDRLSNGDVVLIDDTPGLSLQVLPDGVSLESTELVQATDAQWREAHAKLATHDIYVDNDTKALKWRKHKAKG